MSENPNTQDDFKPEIGKDQWVEQYGNRRKRRPGVLGIFDTLIEVLFSQRRWILVVLIVGALVPFLTDNEQVLQIAGDVVIFGLLALGLHIVAGYSGLLDLGFAGFFLVGGYTYAYMSADLRFIEPGLSLHLPSIVAIISATVLGALVGLLLGASSLRLSGDYLAIVTLGFGLALVNGLEGLTRVQLPGFEDAVNLTGGPDGIQNLDDLAFFGLEISSKTGYYWVGLIALTICILGVYHMNASPTGRAWRSMREDELATQAMGMDPRGLKLRAFAIGAAIAAFAGALHAARQGSIFPSDGDTPRLIITYATVVLGGLGSLPGVVLGALIMNVVPPALQSPLISAFLFYGTLLILLFTMFRPRWQGIVSLVGAGILGTILLFGAGLLSPPNYVIEQLAEEAEDLSEETGETVAPAEPGILSWYAIPENLDMPSNSVLTNTMRSWLVIPEDVRIKKPWAEAEVDCSERRPPDDCWRLRTDDFGNAAFVLAIVLVFVLARVDTIGLRIALMIPTIYLMIVAWELRLSVETSVTRKIFIGLLLVLLMIYRPNGLLGTRRVEVV
ncbi:MAG: branched-chain amino acid ABC transporter permease [Chloroflexota bacterium]